MPQFEFGWGRIVALLACKWLQLFPQLRFAVPPMPLVSNSVAFFAAHVPYPPSLTRIFSSAGSPSPFAERGSGGEVSLPRRKLLEPRLDRQTRREIEAQRRDRYLPVTQEHVNIIVRVKRIKVHVHGVAKPELLRKIALAFDKRVKIALVALRGDTHWRFARSRHGHVDV